MKALGTFLLAAVLSGALHSQLSSCVLSQACDCPPLPDLPAPQAALPIVQAHAWSADGDEEEALPEDPRGGTVEIAGDQLIIRYSKDGAPQQLVYDVIPVR